MTGRAKKRADRAEVALVIEREILRSRIRLFGLAVLCAKVVLVPLVFDHDADLPFVVPKAVVSHGLSYLLAAVIAGLLIRFGRAFVVWSWLHVPVVAFLLASALSSVFGADAYLALYGTHARMLGLGTLADWVTLYFAIVLLVRTAREALIVMACALGASIVVLAYEGIQLLARDPLDWVINGALRPFSTIGQPTSLAQYLSVLALGGLAFAFWVDSVPRAGRLVIAAYSAALLAGAAATATRSIAVGLAAGSGTVVLLTWILHPSGRARLISALATLIAFAAMAALLVFTPLGARISSTVAVPVGDDPSNEPLFRLDASADTRTALYAVALDMFRDRPLLGYGPDNFVIGFPSHRGESMPYEVRQSLPTSAHSWAAQTLASTGLLGLAAFVAIAITAVAQTIRSGFRPLAMVGVAAMATFLGTGLTTVDDLGADWLLWASTGLVAFASAGLVKQPAATPIPLRSGRKTRVARGPTTLRRVISIVCIGAGIALALAGASALTASRDAKDAQLSRQPGRTAEAIALAQSATRRDGGRAEYWHGLGLAYIAAGRNRDGADAFDRASRLAPYDVRYVGDEARALILLDRAGEAGARDRAVQLGERAVRVDPNNPLANLTRALVMQVAGRSADAVQSIERALALDPDSANASLYLTATQVYLAAGRNADAIAVARRGLTFIGLPLATVDLRVELARALARSGQPAEALKEIEAALAIQPNQSAARQLKAEILASIPR